MNLPRIHIWAAVNLIAIALLLVFPKTGFTPVLIMVVLNSGWLFSSKQEIKGELKRGLSKTEITYGFVLVAGFVLIAIRFQFGNLNEVITSGLIRWAAIAALVLIIAVYILLLQSRKSADNP